MTNKNQVALVAEKTITDNVLNRINKMQVEGSLQIPENYSPENALKSAYLKLLDIKTGKDGGYKPVLEVCSQDSIANALLEMVVQGLNPMKNQGYFISYGNKLTFSRSYLGTVAITKRIPGVKDVKGYALYKDDVLETEFDVITGNLKIKKYVPNVKNRNPKDLVGAFGLVVGDEGILHMEYMDLDQIKKSWNQGAMKGDSPAHNNFPDQMAIKTVINRACKMYANTSDDSNTISSLLNKASREVELEIEKNANKEVLEFDEEVIEVDYEVKEEEIKKQVKVNEETGEIIDSPEMEF